MERWITRFSRAVMMGLAWAAGWILISMMAGPFYAGELEPEHIGGPLYAGVICGTIFSGLAGIASGRRQLGELSPYRAAAWGAASGMLVGALPFVIGDQHAPGDRPLWVLPAVVMSCLMVLGAVSAAASPPVARWWKKLNEQATLTS